MKSNLLATALILMAIAPGVHAEKSEAEMLVDGCAELISMYNKKGEKSLLAGMSTSTNEAFLAGYCLGTVKEDYSYKCSNNWYERAKYIAKYNGLEEQYNLNSLLSQSCNGR